MKRKKNSKKKNNLAIPSPGPRQFPLIVFLRDPLVPRAHNAYFFPKKVSKKIATLRVCQTMTDLSNVNVDATDMADKVADFAAHHLQEHPDLIKHAELLTGKDINGDGKVGDGDNNFLEKMEAKMGQEGVYFFFFYFDFFLF
jgi:hypothetical protein